MSNSNEECVPKTLLLCLKGQHVQKFSFWFSYHFFAFEIQILNSKKTSSDAEVIFSVILDLEAPFILKISHICKDYFFGFSRPE